MGDRDCSEAVGDHGISMHVCTFIVNLEHFRRIGIVINRHSQIANNCHAANFTGVEPADMDMRTHPIPEFQVEMGDIMYVRLKMSVRLHLDPFWLFAKEIKQDRYIMRGKIPNDIDISTIES